MFAGDIVELLIDLPCYEFYGRKAVVSNLESKYQGQFTVQLDKQSFRLKPENMLKTDAPKNHPPALLLEELQQHYLSPLGGNIDVSMHSWNV